MSMTQLMESWIATVRDLVREAPKVHPEALRAREVASMLRGAAATDVLDWDTRRDALFEAQRLVPVEEDVLLGARFEDTEIVRVTQLRMAGPLEGPSLDGRHCEAYDRFKKGTPIVEFDAETQGILTRQLALDAQGPLWKREVVGYRASTLDELERGDEDDD